MKLTHHVPTAALRLTEEVSAEYQAEVDRHTTKAQREYEQAEARLAKAELRRQRHMATQSRQAAAGTLREYRRKLAVLDELVELRREELQRLEALMKAHPASTDHRGRGGYRPVPQPGGIV